MIHFAHLFLISFTLLLFIFASIYNPALFSVRHPGQVGMFQTPLGGRRTTSLLFIFTNGLFACVCARLSACLQCKLYMRSCPDIGWFTFLSLLLFAYVSAILRKVSLRVFERDSLCHLMTLKGWGSVVIDCRALYYHNPNQTPKYSQLS